MQLVTQTCYSNECLNNYITTITSANIHSECNTRLPTLHKLQSALLARDVGWRPLHDYPAWPLHCVHLVFTIGWRGLFTIPVYTKPDAALTWVPGGWTVFATRSCAATAILLLSFVNFTFDLVWMQWSCIHTKRHLETFFFSKERLTFNNNTI